MTSTRSTPPFCMRTRGRDGDVRLRADGGMGLSAQRLAQLDMRSSEPMMLTSTASDCCRPWTRLASKLAQVFGPMLAQMFGQRPRGLSWLAVVVL
jgi:hypothetical protein